MDPEFLSRLLPSQGLYCTARLHPNGGFIHRFFPTIAEVVESLRAADAGGHTMYLAQGSFLTGENRKSVNTKAFRSFWIDIDCGAEKFAATPNKAYPTQVDAVKDLRRFCHETALPFPALVNSGNGCYAHWILDTDIPSDKWKALARIFKDVLAHHKFRQDPSRTADAASVLRPVGTHNRKSSEIKEVKLLLDAPAIPLKQFITLLEAAASKAKIATPALAPPTTFKGLNDEFTAGLEGPPASGRKVAQKCAQIRAMRDTLGNISEPSWYACLGVLRHCEEGTDLIHEWSQGHPDYDPSLTEDKVRHHEESGAGPTTCAKFSSENAELCVACPSANKIKSPIVLGRPELEAMVAPETEAAEKDDLTPTGYSRTKDGIFWNDPDSAPMRIYPYDLYPCKISMDGSLGYETVTFRHKLPLAKDYSEFSLRSALMFDPKALLMALADQHVHITGKEQRQHMTTYLESWMSNLRGKRDLATLHTQMGWQPDGLDLTFVLGEQVFKEDGTTTSTGFAKNIPEVARAFHPQGNLAAWRDATEILGEKGMEPLAFAFLAGAFGAPLMKFAGYAGAVVALVGRSGIGKTVIGEFVLSTYGDPSLLRMQKNDTMNAQVSRLGLYGSLPLYLDEVSNIEGQDLSDTLYRITQGRDKARLGRDSREKNCINSWNTLALVSSNHSLVDKLSNLKADASAEMNRIMEVTCRPVEEFGRDKATETYRAFHSNYGVAGPSFVKYLTEHQHEHQDKIDVLTKKIDALSGAGADERFWSAMSAVAIYGGLVAKKLDLISFEIAPILSWLVEQIKDMRGEREEAVATQVDILGQFLDAQAAGVMVTSGDAEGKLPSILREPRGPLVARIMTDKGLLYISRSALKAYLERTYGSYSALKSELVALGALKEHNLRRVLGSGTYVGGTQQPVWLVDLNCPALGRRVVEVVASLGERKLKAV